MLAVQAFAKLSGSLTAAISSMGIGGGTFGYPALVEKQAAESARLFQGYAKARPNKEDAYAAALAFLRGQALDPWQRDLIASALALPIREAKGACVLSSPKFDALLATYEAEARRGDLWRLTWHGLLASYFEFNPDAHKDAHSMKGWSSLREFLARTWPLVDRQAGAGTVPDWVMVLRRESEILSERPVDKYARAYLAGDTAPADSVAADLGIPQSSWFWHAMVLGAIRRATAESDAEFRRLIPRLLQLVQSKPAFRDDAVEHILVRYHGCKGAPADERLRDFVVQPTVWKNPKLKAAGIATAWSRVPDPVWSMVLGWVNERNLKDFFDILAARNKADEGRLAFWSNYLKQITWTRLVFGADTMALKTHNAEIRDLIAREEGAYAELTAKRDVDAFMMQIGPYLIIEFSKKPNACYVYQADELPFEPYERYYSGGTNDLAAGYYGKCAARVVHRDGWEWRAADELSSLGIRPDTSEAKRAQPVTQAGSHANMVQQHPANRTAVDMTELRRLVSKFHGATITDKRGTGGGRLWVSDPSQRALLAAELKSLGFKWAESRQGWYLPEN
ncbi:EH signature domain-containing protein [Hydrogenophaga atypica]|uniref:EH signature domain-containing protein n=1 Tax=Hydrogenophaga atypica TaxID=249409 RepID=A0ABW2QPV7_9BURK